VLLEEEEVVVVLTITVQEEPVGLAQKLQAF
jgi:hypothetical protein